MILRDALHDLDWYLEDPFYDYWYDTPELQPKIACVLAVMRACQKQELNVLTLRGIANEFESWLSDDKRTIELSENRSGPSA